MSTPKNQSLSRALVLLEQVASAPRGTGIKVLAMRAGLSVATAHRLYSAILGRIEARDYDVFSGRARVPTLSKAATAVAALVRRPGSAVPVAAGG